MKKIIHKNQGRKFEIICARNAANTVVYVSEKGFQFLNTYSFENSIEDALRKKIGCEPSDLLIEMATQDINHGKLYSHI